MNKKLQRRPDKINLYIDFTNLFSNNFYVNSIAKNLINFALVQIYMFQIKPPTSIKEQYPYSHPNINISLQRPIFRTGNLDNFWRDCVYI